MKHILMVVALAIITAIALIGCPCFPHVICTAYGADAVAPAAMEPTAIALAANKVMTDTVLPIIIALLSGLATVVLNFIRKKLKLNLTAETEAWIQGQAEHACQYVAELAASKIKFNNIKLTGSDQLDLAIARLMGLVPKLSREDAEKYVLAALARIPGLGATGDASLVPNSMGTVVAPPVAAPTPATEPGKVTPEDIKAALGLS